MSIFRAGREIYGKGVDVLVYECDWHATCRIVELRNRGERIKTWCQTYRDGKKTNEVVDERSGSGHEGCLSRGVPRDRRRREREGQNEVEIVLVQAPVPLSKVNVLLGEQRALLVDGGAHPKPFKEGRPVVVSPGRCRIVPEQPGHSPSDEVGKILKEVSFYCGLIDRFTLA